jgi:prepilin-type processing-associated H-X9-DG protein
MALYIEDSQGYLPRSSGFYSMLRGLYFSNDDPNGPEPLNPVYTKGILFCPMAIRSGREVPPTFRAWEFTLNGAPVRGSYGFNLWLFNPGFAGFDPSIKGATDIFSLSGRGNIPTLLDATNQQSRPFDRLGPNSFEAWGGCWGPFCINRHNGHVNSLFLDWSVRKVGLKELWTLKWYSEFDTANAWTKAGGVLPEDWPHWMRKFKDY